MGKKEVNVGIIGTGHIAQQSHIPAYLSNPHSKIVGVADVDEKKLDEVKKRFNLQKTYSDYTELLEQNIDAVSICVPTKYHSKITVEAANKGVHVLCEKPMALTLEEAEDMINSCKKNDVKLMIGFNYRFIRSHQEAKKMVENGRIGKPFFIHGQFASQGPYEHPEERSSFYFDPQSGGGVLFDSGSHLFDLLRWFFGEVKRVYSCGGTYTKNVEVDDVAVVSLEFENGCVGAITCMWTQIESWSAMRNEGFIKIIGSEGKIISSLFGPSLRYFSKRSKICKIKGEVELVPRGIRDPKNPLEALQRSWRDEIYAFVDAVRLDREVPITGEDGKKVLELILKADQRGRR